MAVGIKMNETTAERDQRQNQHNKYEYISPTSKYTKGWYLLHGHCNKQAHHKRLVKTSHTHPGHSAPFLVKRKYSQKPALHSPQAPSWTAFPRVLSAQMSFKDYFLQGSSHQFRKWQGWQETKKEKPCSRAQSTQQTGVRNSNLEVKLVQES